MGEVSGVDRRSLVGHMRRARQFAGAVRVHGWPSVRALLYTIVGFSFASGVAWATKQDPLTVIAAGVLVVVVWAVVGAYRAWDAAELRAAAAETQRGDLQDRHDAAQADIKALASQVQALQTTLSQRQPRFGSGLNISHNTMENIGGDAIAFYGEPPSEPDVWIPPGTQLGPPGTQDSVAGLPPDLKEQIERELERHRQERESRNELDPPRGDNDPS